MNTFWFVKSKVLQIDLVKGRFILSKFGSRTLIVDIYIYVYMGRFVQLESTLILTRTKKIGQNLPIVILKTCCTSLH